MPVHSTSASRAAGPAVSAGRAGLGRDLPAGYMRIGMAACLPDALRRLGIAPELLFLEAEAPVELFDDADQTLATEVYSRLIACCTAAVGREDFGLLMAEKVVASDLGPVGFLMQQAPDVRTALGDFTRYMRLSDPRIMPLLDVQKNVARISYVMCDPAPTSYFHDAVLTLARNLMRGLCGPSWAPLEVTLARRRPAAHARYERFFGAPVRFDAEASALFFADTWLDATLPNADLALRRMLQEQVDILERSGGGTATERVKRYLRTGLPTQSGSLAGAGEALAMNGRTLARHLEAEGTTFKDISDEVRFDLARQLLANTAMPMTDISLVLHYSEASAFTRAFRHWSGMTPRAWREQQARASRG